MPRKKLSASNNPFEKDIGYVAARPNKITNGWNVLYKNDDYDIETGKWSVLCSSHSTLINCRLKRKSESMLLHPTEWCSHCKEIKDTEEAKLILEKIDERPIDEQIRLLAQLVKGDAEKCAMFEELHHIKPDVFWDKSQT
jgi:hypothetical protein